MSSLCQKRQILHIVQWKKDNIELIAWNTTKFQMSGDGGRSWTVSFFKQNQCMSYMYFLTKLVTIN